MRWDIAHTADGDIDLGTGDIAYADGTERHKWDLVVADKGHYKENPAVGVGASNYLHDTDPENFQRAVRKECGKDGMKVKDVRYTGTKLTIDAEYEKDNG